MLGMHANSLHFFSEFNSSVSDARSGSIVDDRIRPALESGSAIGSTKPMLLVIDEIDGATGSGESVSLRTIDYS